MSKKWYVVWVGTEPGICETWEECQIRTQGYPGARYKAFDSSREAIEAYRKDLDAHADPRAVIRAIAHAETSRTNYANIKEIYPGSVAVCGSCDHATGMMQYRGVDVWSGTELFRFGLWLAAKMWQNFWLSSMRWHCCKSSVKTALPSIAPTA